MKSSRLCLAILAPVLFLCGPTAAGADEQRPADEPYSPPVVSFNEDERGLGLLDAVRLTLEHDPRIKLRDAETDLKEGVLREVSGQFDLTLRADGSFQYTQEELRDSVKESEIENRRQLDEAIPVVTQRANDLSQAIVTLRDPRAVSDPGSVDFTAGITDAALQDDLALLQAQLIFLTDLIARTPDATLRQDLIRIRQQAVDAANRRFAEQAEEIAGLPERLRKLREDLGDAPEDQWAKDVNVHAELTKLFRSGILVAPYFDGTYSARNYVGKDSTDPEQGGLGIKDLYRAELGFEIIVPLKRGLGRASVAAAENAARADLEASSLLLLHQKSQSVLATLLAYWDLRAAQDQVEVARRSVKLQGRLVFVTRELIKANDVPRSDEARVLASQADAQARLEAAERRLNETRLNLVEVMGVSVHDARAAPLASDAFPGASGALVATDGTVAALADEALGRRHDHRATFKVQEAGRVLARAAQLDTRRLVNLDLRVFGTSVNEESPDLDSWVFRSGSAAVEVEVPFKNNTLEGRRMQREASLEQARIDTSDLARTIKLNVVRLARSLSVASEQLKKAEQAVGYYDQTIKDEQDKLKAGASTLVDTILTEQQTTSARITRVNAQREFAGLLARLRFEAGLLVLDADVGGRVSEGSLSDIPARLLGR